MVEAVNYHPIQVDWRNLNTLGCPYFMSTNIKTDSQHFQFAPELLLSHYQNRKKIFWHSEIVDTIRRDSVERNTVIDPFWLYTQSGKNYQQQADKLILEHYSMPEVFAAKVNEFSLSNRLVDISTKPLWANQILNNYWYWRQQKAAKIAQIVYLFPGVKSVFVTGSAALEICTHRSDLDFAVQTYPGLLLPARFWCLGLFKLNNFLNQRHKKNESSTPVFDPKSSVRTDFGLIYDNEDTLIKFFGLEERQLFILNKLLVLNNLSQLKDQPESANGCLYNLPKNRLQFIYVWPIKIILWIITYLIYPLISLQIFWYKVRKKNKFSDEYVSRDFCCFYPTHGFYRNRLEQIPH